MTRSRQLPWGCHGSCHEGVTAAAIRMSRQLPLSRSWQQSKTTYYTNMQSCLVVILWIPVRNLLPVTVLVVVPVMVLSRTGHGADSRCIRPAAARCCDIWDDGVAAATPAVECPSSARLDRLTQPLSFVLIEIAKIDLIIARRHNQPLKGYPFHQMSQLIRTMVRLQ